MDLSQLRQHLDANPGLYGGLSDPEAADAGNALDQTKLMPIPSAELLAWSASNNRFTSIKAAADNVNHPVNSVASAAYLMITRDGTTLDLSLSDRMALVDALVASSVLTADDKTSLLALATKPASRFELAGLPGVEAKHVRWARGL